MVKFDLNWLVTGPVDSPTCDLWEEPYDRGFLWNRVTIRSALLAGAALAEKMGDSLLAAEYRSVGERRIGDPTENHLDLFLTECPAHGAGPACRDKNKGIDSAVILALTYAANTRELLGSGGPLGPASLEVIARTVQAYNAQFCELYTVNQRDAEEGVPGILYGRYAKDVYGGGNPWQLLTAALASLMYQTAAYVGEGRPLSLPQLNAWRSALFAGFNGAASDFVAAGDAILLRLVHHIDEADDWHLYEQIDRETGQQYNAKDLTWSYAEVLSALQAREHALEVGEAHSQKSPSSAASARPGEALMG